MKRLVVSTILLSMLCVTALAAPKKKGNDLEQRRKALRELLSEQWEYTLSQSPEYASILGDKRWNDQVSDFSQKAIDQQLADTKKFLKRFEAIDPAGFTEQEALNRTLMVRDLRNEVVDAQFRRWRMPVNQMGGIHLDAPQLASLLQFEKAKDYDDYISRLRKFPVLMDQNVEQMRRGVAEGLVPPRFLLEKVVDQAAGIAALKGEQSPFAQPLQGLPKDLSEVEQKRIRKALVAAVDESVIPAYGKFEKFVREEYAPKGRTDVGVWSLPDGAARYANAARRSTTTDLPPEEIHRIGLREVALLEEQMLVIARKQGYADLKTFNASLEKNRALRPTSRENILEIYRAHISAMEKKLPQLFGRLPKAGMKVMPVEEFREKEAAGASYQRPAADGSRPGFIMVNTSDYENRKTISFESTSYHEGVPGHHLQIAIAQELPELPPFRAQGGYTAFVEGWALYSERLGKDVGFYQNPYSDYGRLQDEMLRAIRLVVDTGLHSKKWTREQVVKFFRDHSAIDEVDIQSETDRYIVWPGQALAYKIGQLKILELRERAKKDLGAKFDIRSFHDQILGGGALPLDVLEDRINRWIAETKKV